MTLEQAMTGGVMQGSGRSELCGGESVVYWQLPFSGTRAVGFGAHDLTRPLCHELQVYIYGLNPAESCSHSVGATRRARDLQKIFRRVLRRVLAVAKVSRSKNWSQRGGVSDARKRVKGTSGHATTL